MFKENWDGQIKVYVDLKKNIVRDIFHKTVLKKKYVKNKKTVVCS